MKDEPAFPTYGEVHSFTNQFVGHSLVGGLTKREYFAAKAMQGLLAAVYSSKGSTTISENAVSYADALIAELKKK